METNKSLREERDKMEQELQQTQAKVSLADDFVSLAESHMFSSSALEISFSSFVHYNHSIIQILQVFKFDVDNTHEKSLILFFIWRSLCGSRVAGMSSVHFKFCANIHVYQEFWLSKVIVTLKMSKKTNMLNLNGQLNL